MPTDLSWFCRLIWIASQVLALLACTEIETKYRWWMWYLAVNIGVGVLYWPELSGWWSHMWVAVLILNALRLASLMEAFYVQT